MSIFKGQEHVLDFLEALVGAGWGSNNYKAVADLPQKEFDELRNNLPYIARTVRQLERDVKAVQIERHTDYDKLVRWSKRHFTDLDIIILEQLHGNDETALYYRGFDAPYQTPMADIRKSVKRLRRRGLIEHVTGLMGEDGAAGSGFMENARHYDTIEQIINNYRLEQGELPV